LTYLHDEELRQNTELVHLIKDYKRSTKHHPVYKRVVYKGDVAEKHGTGKPTSTRVTVERPQLLRDYTAERRAFPTPPLTAADLADPPDYNTLLSNVTNIQPGTDAREYEDTVEAVLSAIFDGHLSFPEREVNIHHGRKRVDIVYSNTALAGFFKWVGTHYAAPYVVIECKNYVGDPANPELDQIAGRFSPSRGRVGFIVCRSFHDKDRFIERCRDTALDQRGFVIALDDSDLGTLVTLRTNDDLPGFESFLRARFAQLVR
jgi:hypothetical protein